MEDKNLNDFLPDKNASYYKKLNNSNFETIITKEEVVDELQKVMDPEIPVNLYEIGLIYKIKIDSSNNVFIDMTLTNPNCPVAGTMPESVGIAVQKIKNISSIQVNLVWNPKWDKSMM